MAEHPWFFLVVSKRKRLILGLLELPVRCPCQNQTTKYYPWILAPLNCKQGSRPLVSQWHHNSRSKIRFVWIGKLSRRSDKQRRWRKNTSLNRRKIARKKNMKNSITPSTFDSTLTTPSYLKIPTLLGCQNQSITVKGLELWMSENERWIVREKPLVNI